MGTVQLPHRYSFGGLSFATLARMTTEIDGGGLRPVRGENAVIPGLPGRRHQRKADDEVRFGLTLYVGAWDEDGQPISSDGAVDAQANVDELLTTLGRSRHLVLPLAHTLPSGSVRTAQAEAVDAQVSWPTPESALVVVDFLLHDYWYTGEISDGPHALAGATSWSLTHPGTVRGWKVLIDWLGPIENPRLTNDTNGVYVECLVDVAAGTHLLIDCAAWTAENDGDNAIGSIVHEGDFPYMVLEPGANALRATATTYGGSVSLSFEPPYY